MGKGRNTPKIITKKLDFSTINDLNFERLNLKKFPVVKILEQLPNHHSLFETVIVASNDSLVNMFLNRKIQFLDISKNLLKIINNKEFRKYKRIIPQKIDDIVELSNYVSLKINSLDI